MLPPADLALLPALDALLAEESVTRAAMRLGISQPSLSAKLARLRELTGDALLVPAGHGRSMVLTPRATQMRATVREALASATAALSGAPGFDPVTSRATFRIVANDNAAALTLALLLANVATDGARHLRVALLRPDGRSLVERLDSGDADLAIAGDDALPGGDWLLRRPVLRDRFATAQRRGHPRGPDHPFDLDAFCAADHLMVVTNPGAFDGVVDEVLTRIGRCRRVVLSVQSYALAPLIVAHSDLITTLPRMLLEQYGDALDLFEPPVSLPEFTLSALWHKRTNDDPAARWVRDRLFAVGVSGGAAALLARGQSILTDAEWPSRDVSG